MLDAYHVPFPGVRKWYDKIRSEVKTTGYLVSPLGQTRRFFGDIDRNHNMLRVCRGPNFNLSNSVEILNKVFGEPIKISYSNTLMIYASKRKFMIQYLWAMAHHNARLLVRNPAECMYNPVVVHGRTLVIPIDIKHGQNWAEREVLKDGTVVNPNGTVKYKFPKKKEAA